MSPPFVRESAPHVAPLDISPGAFAVGNRRVVVGTFSGWAIYDLPTLDLLASNAHALPSESLVIGVQWHGADVLMLAQQPGKTKELLALDQAHTLRALHTLPSGDWQMVRHVSGPRSYLYDVTEGVGVVSYDRRGQCWRVAMPDVRKVMAAASQLLCLGRGRLIVLDDDGRVALTAALPDTCTWTAATRMPDGSLLLGGHDKRTHDYALATLDRHGKLAGAVAQHPLASVFTAKTIRMAFADRECGLDLFHVARMYATGARTLVVALGGGGDALGASQGAAALAVVTLGERVQWQSCVIDTEDGISGFAPLADGRWLADLCGELRVYGPG